MIKIKKFQFTNTELMKKAHNIRYDVFVIGQNCPEEIEWEFEEESTHFLVFDNKEAVATARHRKTNNGYKLERFAVLDSNKGNIYMHAQENVIPFYEKMGFVKEGDLFEEANITHYKMSLNR